MLEALELLRIALMSAEEIVALIKQGQAEGRDLTAEELDGVRTRRIEAEQSWANEVALRSMDDE